MHKVKMGTFAALVLGCFSITSAQTLESQQRFDVAAIHLVQGAVRTGLHGGPGTPDPTHIDWVVSREVLVSRAYNVELDQISPEWQSLMTPIYEIVATVPEGTTQEQFRQMVQSLLTERFHLVTHQENRNIRAYKLVVAKSGSKMRISEYVPPSRPANVPGRLYISNGVSSRRVAGQWTMTGKGAAIADLIRSLSVAVHARILDQTGLTDRYDFTVSYSEGSDLPGSFVADAVRDKLGLELQPAAISLPFVVIDRFDKTPTEN